MTTKELKDKFEKVCSQGQQIQKTLKYHQNKLKSLFSNPKTDSTVLEAALDKLATVYSELDACINQDYPQLKFNFFPSNMDVSYSVKYAGGTFPDDLTLCHNKKSKLKEIRSSLKRKIISKELSKVSCVEERDCVIAVDMKRMVVRGVVIGVTHQIVKLLDIDTGDYKNAVVDNIYELDEEAVSLYALCVRCGLDGDLADLKEFWTADLSHYFISALNYGELVIETSHYVDESTSIPPRFKVTIEVFVDDTKVLNVNHWVCDQLLPLVKREAQNCLDLQKVIQGLDPKVLMPYLQVGSGVSLDSSSNLSDSVVCSSQIISSPESSARSSSSESSEEYSVDIQIDKFDTPSFLPSTSAVINGPALSSGKKEIDVYFTNENMVASPSSESLVAERSKSKCDCGTNCAPIVGCCPPELLQSNPKVPRITTVIPSLASIPHGEPFYYKMKNKSKSSLLPTPSTTHTNTSGDTNKSETELRSMESAFYNKSNGRLPPDGIKHRSDNSLSSTSPSHLGSSSRRGPRSHLYTLPLPSYMTEADGYGAGLNASAGDAFVGGVGYPEEKLVPLSGSGGSGPNSRGEGLSLKQQHFCLAGHLDKVQCVKLPRSVLLVEPGQERKALISFTETPSKFFVNIVDENNAHLEQLEEELCSHYSQVNNLVSLVTIEEARYHLGEYVAAKWKSDNRWYRARVIDWNVCTKNSIAILYVDHGNVDLVPLDYIQPLDPHFTQYAIMALPCHLAHVSPASSSGWSQDAIDMFSQFCDKPLELFYLTFQPSGSNDSFCSWSVVLRNAKGECINELLVSAGHAIHTGKINGHTTPAPVPPAPAQPPTPTPLTPAPTPDRDQPREDKEKTSNSSTIVHMGQDSFKPLENRSDDSKAVFYKEQIARNRIANLKALDRIIASVKADGKVLILLRGLPGCGKTTWAEELVNSLCKLSAQSKPVLFNADQYFETPEGYKYDVKKIGEAHNWTYKRTELAMTDFTSPIIIDNTNTEEFEIMNYYNLAYHNWYSFFVLEPETEWAFDVKELARKTKHGVPVEKIGRMLRKYVWPNGQVWGKNSGIEGCTQQLQDSKIT
uniref:NEDD4-binding protein 2-like 2 n=1 Tax=Cacopsylla melanoneura TaxID=428564 RepID=A0A8D8MGJ5_9HEMI